MTKERASESRRSVLRWLVVLCALAGIVIGSLNFAGRIVSLSLQLLILGLGGAALWWRVRASLAATFLVFGVLTLSAQWLVFEAVASVLQEMSEYRDSVPFDAEQWRAAEPGFSHGNTDPLRLRMVDDLLESERLLARTRDEVVELLGPPDDYGQRPAPELNYHLRPERGFIRIDSEHLRIRLNDQERVIEAFIWRD